MSSRLTSKRATINTHWNKFTAQYGNSKTFEDASEGATGIFLKENPDQRDIEINKRIQEAAHSHSIQKITAVNERMGELLAVHAEKLNKQDKVDDLKKILKV